MPELPEVETIRLKLIPNLVGKTIKDVKVLENKQFIGKKANIIDNEIISINRYGKVLVFQLAKPVYPERSRRTKLAKPGNNVFINIHLKMTGEILFTKDKNKAIYDYQIPRSHTNKLPNQHTRVIITFFDNSAIFFNDLRKFGWIKVTDKPEKPKGVDVLSKNFTLPYLNPLTKIVNKPVKQFLLDQDKITGIGNIYANESLWLAKINPQRKTKSLSKQEIALLYKSILKIINEAIKYQGSSGADEMYVMPDAKKGNYQHYFKVYQRENQPCLRCKTKIKRIKQNNRSSFFCPKCQK